MYLYIYIYRLPSCFFTIQLCFHFIDLDLFLYQSALSLSDQLDLFKEYISKIDAAVGQERRATILSKSLFMVCLGSNDIANTYYSTPVRSSHYDISAYTDLMVNSASNFFQVNSKHLFNNENKLSHVVGLYWVTWSTYEC